MNGINHYQRAEELLQRYANCRYQTDADANALVAAAHAHAALAQAYAMTDAKNFVAALYGLNGEEPPAAAARKRNAATKSTSAAADFLPDGI
ncbi:hypothetical protein ABZV67_10645 [Streptomyces sp. NPDC005065]|uniref:hypothetical protein n=1 Tax=Streptomyces sp. NPDC005065 TaxID=3154461 RepID=UPI0033B08D31